MSRGGRGDDRVGEDDVRSQASRQHRRAARRARCAVPRPELDASIGARHVELDALYHGPNWTPAEPDVFRARVADAIASERWVTDGNYSVARPVIWAEADTLVWLDYAFPRVFWRLARRTVGRYVRREELWNGNRESLWWHFLPNDKSLFYWAAKTHWKHRRTYLEQIDGFPHLQVERLRSPSTTEHYLAAIGR